jgi:DNA-binding NtrC family response regulator
MSLELPSLRERTGDIPLLVERFLGPSWQIEQEARQRLESFPWPGNVRQLINALDRAKIMADDNTIRLKDLPKEVASVRPPDAAGDSGDTAPPADDLASIQRQKIVEVLRRVSCNKSRAAKTLGIDRRKLYRLLEKFSISDAEVFDNPAVNGKHRPSTPAAQPAASAPA